MLTGGVAVRKIFVSTLIIFNTVLIAQTNVSGNITQNTTWTKSASPYNLSSNINVLENDTSQKDYNTGMKGLFPFMIRNKFCDLYKTLNDPDKYYFQQIIKHIIQYQYFNRRIYIYMTNNKKEKDIGSFKISVGEWLQTIINPGGEVYQKVVQRYISEATDKWGESWEP